MSENNTNSSAGMGILGWLAVLLTVLFVGLKLGEVGAVAEWSWWWVLSPLWLLFCLVLVILILVFLISIAIAFFKSISTLAGKTIRLVFAVILAIVIAVNVPVIAIPTGILCFIWILFYIKYLVTRNDY